MTIRCIIVDDEPIAREILTRYIAQVPYLELVGVGMDAFEAMALLNQASVDLLLLDINMPRLSGFEMLRSLKKYPAVIITSAYPEYALEGFELAVTDYLLKPFSFARFVQATEKVAGLARGAGAGMPSEMVSPGTVLRTTSLRETELRKTVPGETVPGEAPEGGPGRTQDEPQEKTGRPPGAAPFLMVRSDKKLTKVYIDEITYVEAYGNYIYICREADRIMSKQTLTQFEQLLPAAQFVRIHKSFIASIRAIRYIEGNEVSIGSKKLPVGKVYKDNLLKRLG